MSEGWRVFARSVWIAALYGVDVDRLTDSVRSIGAAAYIDTSGAALGETLARGWGQAVEEAMDDHFLSNEEKRTLNRYRVQHNLSAHHLDGGGCGRPST